MARTAFIAAAGSLWPVAATVHKGPPNRYRRCCSSTKLREHTWWPGMKASLRFWPLVHLVTFSPPMDLPPLDIQMMWHKSTHLSPAHVWLRDQVIQVCRQQSPGTDGD